MGTDGHELEWSIQDRYVTATKQLGRKHVPMLYEFHKGNANGGRTFMTKGTPDTLTFYRVGDKVHQLWIEFKRHNGKVSPDQESVIATMREIGQDVIVCYSAEEAINALSQRLGLVNQKEKS
jgi:hypothetical protein